jgi:hypothetical protein
MQNVTIDNFKRACDAFINSKYILFDKKLESLIGSVADSEDVYNLIAECLKNFDFETEKNAALARGGFTPPIKSEKIIALNFCILSDIDEKKIDFYKFLITNFKQDNINESFNEFNRLITLPFKNAVSVMLETKEDELIQIVKQEEEAEAIKLEADKNKKNILVLDKIMELSKNYEKSPAAEIIVLGIKTALLQNNKQLANALLIGFTHACKNKKFRKYATPIIENSIKTN